MTRSLQNAFEVASRLPEAEQDALAAAILTEIEAEARFDAAIVGSADALERLADEAVEDQRAGRTKALDPASR